MTQKEKLINFLIDDIKEIIYAVSTNEQLQQTICNVGNGNTFQDLASYWERHLPQLESRS